MAATRPRRGRIEPLWDRIERNKLKTAVFVTLFVLAAAISAGVLVAAGGIFLGVVLVSADGFDDYFRAYPHLVGSALFIGAGLGILHVLRTLTSPHRRLPVLFGAQLSTTGTLLPTKSALKDMALAAGYRHAPPLWVIPDCDRVNAFVVGLSESSAIIGVTRGFTERLSIGSQRAVFANLMARLHAGDTMSATAISAVMGPIWASREAGLRRQEEAEEPLATLTTQDGMHLGGQRQAVAVFGGFVVAVLSILITEALMAGHERAAYVAAEKADAEGMLLLKDPEAMVRALEEVLECNNTVPGAGEAYSMLFYCWAGFGYAPEDDPEMRRIGRLREVIGAAGADVQRSLNTTMVPR